MFVLSAGDVGFYAGESENIRERVESILENPRWKDLEADSVLYVEEGDDISVKYALKAALAQRMNPLLNCRLLVTGTELPGRAEND